MDLTVLVTFSLVMLVKPRLCLARDRDYLDRVLLGRSGLLGLCLLLLLVLLCLLLGSVIFNPLVDGGENSIQRKVLLVQGVVVRDLLEALVPRNWTLLSFQLLRRKSQKEGGEGKILQLVLHPRPFPG